MYPAELYIIVRTPSDGLAVGTYHVDVHGSALELIDSISIADVKIKEIFGHSWVANAPIIVVCTAVIHRTEQKYGDRALRYILFEMGHIMQNILILLAAPIGLKACPIGAFVDKIISHAIAY